MARKIISWVYQQGKDPWGAGPPSVIQKKSQPKDTPNVLYSDAYTCQAAQCCITANTRCPNNRANPTLCTGIFIKFQPNQVDPVQQTVKRTERKARAAPFLASLLFFLTWNLEVRENAALRREPQSWTWAVA